MARREYDVCADSDLEPGSMRVFSLDGLEILLLRSQDGGFHAMRSTCSHMGAPLAQGRMQLKMEGSGQGGYAVSRCDEVVRCPWHGYEFDIRSGRCAGDPDRVRVKTFGVATRDGRVFVER